MYLPNYPKNIEIGKSSWHNDAHVQARKYAFLGYLEGNIITITLPKILPTKRRLSRKPEIIF